MVNPTVRRARWGWRWFNLTHLSYLLIGLWATSGAIATTIYFGPALVAERQAQRLFVRLRGTMTPPDSIVILAMDQESLARGEDYQWDPERYPELEPIQSWPWQRTAYANVIERLMAAGARSVSLDVILADPSSYGANDDHQLQSMVQRYSRQVVLANLYEAFGTPEAGEQGQIINPNPVFAANPTNVGLINFAPDPDGRVYRIPEEFIDQVVIPQGLGENISSFAATTARAAGYPDLQFRGSHLFFYGPPATFKRVPFWHVLDPSNWAVHLQDETFKDKIVLIGPTASFFQDFVRTPFSDTLPGVELHANAIATLIENRAIADAIPDSRLQGLLVLVSVAGTGLVLSRLLKRPALQLWATGGALSTWGVMTYASFTYGGLILPTAIPMMAIALSGISCLVTGAIGNYVEQRRLRQTLERYVAAPIVHEILTHYSDDFQALLKGRRVRAAVLFCDIRSFTTFSLQLEPEALVEQLNDYLNAMVEAILDAGGTLDKFVGDAVMAEFGSPISQGEATDAMNAIHAALGMRRALATLQEQWHQQGKVIFFNGIGINFGEAIAGDIGSVRRREYALIGDAVNVASRVESLTRKFWTDILITDSLYQLVQDKVEVVCVGKHELKGRGNNQVMLYSLVGLKGEDHTLYQQIHEKFRSQAQLPG